MLVSRPEVSTHIEGLAFQDSVLRDDDGSIVSLGVDGA